MVLYVTSQECSEGAGFEGQAGNRVMVTLRPGRGSDGAPHGLWRYVCCQRRPILKLPSCRYTGLTRTGFHGCFANCLYVLGKMLCTFKLMLIIVLRYSTLSLAVFFLSFVLKSTCT